jgi:hypothetical protein
MQQNALISVTATKMYEIDNRTEGNSYHMIILD